MLNILSLFCFGVGSGGSFVCVCVFVSSGIGAACPIFGLP